MAMSSLSLQTNIPSMTAQRSLKRTETEMNTAMARLSSGMRINIGADDAAGLAISEKLRAQVRGLAQAQRNANDGISFLQTAEGALSEVGNMLIRMRELSIQAANGTLGDAERISINDEFVALRAEIDRIAAATEFNGTSLLNGSVSAGVTFQVGIDNIAANDRITVSLADMKATAIGLTGAMTLSTVTGAQGAMAILDAAVQTVASQRGSIGVGQNRLEVTINNLAAMHENLSAANSRIRDADIASESANFSRNQILMQAGVSVLAQANSLPSMVLSLIG